MFCVFTVPLVGLQCMVVVFPGYTHFFKNKFQLVFKLEKRYKMRACIAFSQ